MFVSSAIALALAAVSIAAPARPRQGFGGRPSPGRGPRFGGACDLSSFNMPESGIDGFVEPEGSPSFIGIGVGTQNYTCNDAGTYDAIGALADIYDISCLAGTDMFNTVQDAVLRGVPRGAPVLGKHFFEVTEEGTFPKWDFTTSQNNPDAFVRVTKISDAPAPPRGDEKDVAWLELQGVAGGLGTKVYRTDTRLGTKPDSCTPGSDPIFVRYSAKYYFYGATITPATE